MEKTIVAIKTRFQRDNKDGQSPCSGRIYSGSEVRAETVVIFLILLSATDQDIDATPEERLTGYLGIHATWLSDKLKLVSMNL